VYSGFIRAILLNHTICFSWNWLLQRLKQSNHITVNESDLASSERAESIRVLHVDDDLSNLEISKQIMKDMDASLEFDCACCMDEVFKKLSTGQYDVVISDYEMPQKDGSIIWLSALANRVDYEGLDQGFTTGRGSGLGLYLIKKMIEVYEWTIEENGEPDKGAKFTIRISEIDRNSKMKTVEDVKWTF
jgi:hypothetical protein